VGGVIPLQPRIDISTSLAPESWRFRRHRFPRRRWDTILILKFNILTYLWSLIMSHPIQSFQDVVGLGGIASHAIRHPLDFHHSVGPTLNEFTGGLIGSSFDPERDTPDQSGKVIFVTGGQWSKPEESLPRIA
jgi:hypothetical protein